MSGGPAELLQPRCAGGRRADRHGYWFPLVLLGVLTVAAAPLYVAPEPPARGLAADQGR